MSQAVPLQCSCNAKTWITSFIEVLEDMSNIISLVGLIDSANKLESLVIRRGTFKDIDVKLTLARIEEQLVKFASSEKEIRDEVLNRCDVYLEKLDDSERVSLPSIVSNIAFAMGAEPNNAKVCEGYIEKVILDSCSQNDVPNRYFRVVKGKNSGICMFEKRHKF